ncbi:hypothetical protein LTS18_007204 [Coniosporium uncinatum]|uniref:Uncharacterized protein n=1 Tax=Coniosporium uncinatum TaxID=93489 RepID=A0ACC3DPA9_9PEZI|nr:hypothetical protein LTS18_007204 [Coniosporium uncinatum]
MIWIDFHQDDGSLISNIVSEGPSGKPEDLMMTYYFEWRRPDVQEGSADVEKVMEQYKKTAKMAVHESIDTIRRFVESGEIK